MPYKDNGPWRFFSYDKNTESATCLIVGCSSKLKISKNSNKSLKSHLLSFKHNMPKEDVDQEMVHVSILNYSKKRKLNMVDSLCFKIIRLVAITNISINKILTDEDLRDLLYSKYRVEVPKSFPTIRKMIIEGGDSIKKLIKEEISKHLSISHPSFMFDEWTSRNNMRFLALIVRINKMEFTIGLLKVEGIANSGNLQNLIKKCLSDFGIDPGVIPCFTADGASVNSRISKDMNILIQKCYNHGIHLGNLFLIPNFINKKIKFLLILFSQFCSHFEIYFFKVSLHLFIQNHLSILKMVNNII